MTLTLTPIVAEAEDPAGDRAVLDRATGVPAAGLRVLMVDPSLFTAPYDAALSRGLRRAGVCTQWAVRGLRRGEEADLDPSDRALTCYRLGDGARRRPGKSSLAGRVTKGIEHWLDSRRIAALAGHGGYDLVHFQWAVMPAFDIPAMRRIARRCPVVLTVHDVTPFNGAGVHLLQRHGFDALFDAADHLIVHTQRARAALVARGVDDERISVIGHGPLPLRATPRPVADKTPGRWRVVLFGRLQGYKGVDVLIEALGLLPGAVRDRLEVVVAGDPLIDLDPLRARAAALGLDEPVLRLRPGRMDEQAMADLLASADSFVFPYRAIEASGVLFLVAGLARWTIASDLGAFADVIGHDGTRGRLVMPGDAAALAAALCDGIGRRPAANASIPDWNAIGQTTAALYRRLIADRKDPA